MSAALAFYSLVSVAPLFLLALWLTSLLAGDRRVELLAQLLGDAAPEGLGIDQAVRRAGEIGTSLGVTAVVLGLWPATAYGSGLKQAFERLSAKPTGKKRGLRGRGLLLLGLLPIFVLGAIAGSYAGTAVTDGEGLARVAGWVLGLVTGFTTACVSVALILRIFPPERLPLRSIVRGTLASAIGISLLSLGFTIYLGSGANFVDHYVTSGVAAVVLFGVWLFLSNAMLLVGYEVAIGEDPKT